MFLLGKFCSVNMNIFVIWVGIGLTTESRIAAWLGYRWVQCGVMALEPCWTIFGWVWIISALQALDLRNFKRQSYQSCSIDVFTDVFCCKNARFHIGVSVVTSTIPTTDVITTPLNTRIQMDSPFLTQVETLRSLERGRDGYSKIYPPWN